MRMKLRLLPVVNAEEVKAEILASSGINPDMAKQMMVDQKSYEDFESLNAIEKYAADPFHKFPLKKLMYQDIHLIWKRSGPFLVLLQTNKLGTIRADYILRTGKSTWRKFYLPNLQSFVEKLSEENPKNNQQSEPS